MDIFGVLRRHRVVQNGIEEKFMTRETHFDFAPTLDPKRKSSPQYCRNMLCWD